jgi:hypothetical protein
MALSSNLFKADRALEACAVDNSAHLTLGATGEHVGKVQFALFELDGLIIDRSELAAQKYGKSTAAAVLSYKTRRQIINRSYQKSPDAIVGKMTIASLDDEMKVNERRFEQPGDCLLSPSGAPTFANTFGASSSNLFQQTLSLNNAGVGKTAAPKQLGGFVRVFFATTLRSSIEDGYPLSAHIERARDCLFEHGITLSVEVRNGFADTIRMSAPIINSFVSVADNVDELRKMSEDLRPGLPGVLRVIVCQMVGDKFGETFRNRHLGPRLVPPFVLLNSQQKALDHATLIHEMIHASKNGPVAHDDEKNSVFFKDGKSKPGEIDQTLLKAEHAATLATMSSRL